MQLEVPVLIVELFLFLLVELGDLVEDLTPLLPHLDVDLLLRPVEADIEGVLLLKILRRLLVLQVLSQHFYQKQWRFIHKVG